MTNVIFNEYVDQDVKRISAMLGQKDTYFAVIVSLADQDMLHSVHTDRKEADRVSDQQNGWVEVYPNLNN